MFPSHTNRNPDKMRAISRPIESIALIALFACSLLVLPVGVQASVIVLPNPDTLSTVPPAPQALAGLDGVEHSFAVEGRPPIHVHVVDGQPECELTGVHRRWGAVLSGGSIGWGRWRDLYLDGRAGH